MASVDVDNGDWNVHILDVGNLSFDILTIANLNVWFEHFGCQ
jgi:hypothetical protein